MARKELDWQNGAVLENHTRKKHSILTEYFRAYLLTRCCLPQQDRFRLAIVDGFAGGGKYQCGSFGSPLLFVDTLVKTAHEINTRRAVNGLKRIDIECLLLLNDYDPGTLELLKQNIAPLLAHADESEPAVHIKCEFSSGVFEAIYPDIKARLKQAKCNNVLFNLDQYGYSKVPTGILRDIISSWKRAEILLTFTITALLAFLSPRNKRKAGVPLEPEVQEKINQILDDEQLLNKNRWLGEAEKIVFDHLKACAPFVSPFSIQNPGGGWRYWLMHFANSYRARQVYNNVLHESDSSQGHFGRTGLNMLAYDPSADQGHLYLFDFDSRALTRDALTEDIPRMIAESGDAISIEDFYAAAYSETPAHSDDIHESMITNPEIEVITPNGGKRREASAIKVNDTLKLTSQRVFSFGSG
ncbi:three-Cys-motif partner protein TcmP [Salinisphaera sp. PC39]|uniref:three-Cys-motif partner protein TcmP n=1 Tax=Salinisphaera sp. PC39 TaxID=1304156 RepID=UPI00334154BE